MYKVIPSLTCSVIDTIVRSGPQLFEYLAFTLNQKSIFSNGITENDVRQLVRPVIQAVATLHDHGLAHR